MKRQILMLEHDEDDRYITQAVLDEVKADVSIEFVSDSTALFKKLGENKIPDLLLITYGALPMNVVEILRRIRSTTSLKHLPVVVLSGATKPAIVKECYEAGASSFVTKPSTGTETTLKITSFLDYWLRTVELP
jgi:CheY-like chemotaxis protein